MLDKMEARRNAEDPHGQSHREKISAAMKAKWRDEEYRNKTIAAIQRKRAQTEALRPKQTKAPRARAAVASKPVDGVRIARPVQPKRKRPVKTRVLKKSVAAAPVKPLNGMTTAQVDKTLRPSSSSSSTDKSPVLKLDIDIHDTQEEEEEEEDKKAASSLDAEPDGSLNRLREERRDLYDLLYGDDGASSAARLDLGDENLDTFDPYGLEDF
jgi:hypothetical protein